MTFIVRIPMPNGEPWEVECATAQDVFALRAAQSQQTRPQSVNGHAPKKPARPTETTKEKGDNEDHRTARMILEAIQKAGPAGATSEALMSALGVEDAQKFGGKMTRATGAITDAGLKPADLFETRRYYSAGKKRVLRVARPKIAEAIEKLRKKGG
jgi:hypothetical protein